MRTSGRIGLPLAVACMVGTAVDAAPRSAVDSTLTAYLKPHRLIEVEPGRRIHLVCRGTGAPTVILTAGLTDWSGEWSKSQGDIARTTRVCAWDRAGYGFSDPSAEPQTPRRTTTDLELALRNGRIPGPYVMVAHSAGSFEALMFTDRHPRSVVGMVLVDPSIPDQTRLMQRAGPKIDVYSRPFDAQQRKEAQRCLDRLKSGTLKYGSPNAAKCFDYPPDYPQPIKNMLLRRDMNPRRFATRLSLTGHFATGDSDRSVINPKRDYGALPLIILTAAKVSPFRPTRQRS